MIVTSNSVINNVLASSSINTDHVSSTLELDSTSINDIQASSQQTTPSVKIQQTSSLHLTKLISSSSQIVSLTTDASPSGTSKLLSTNLSMTKFQPIPSLKSGNYPSSFVSSHVLTTQYHFINAKTST